MKFERREEIEIVDWRTKIEMLRLETGMGLNLPTKNGRVDITPGEWNRLLDLALKGLEC